jgi:dihydrofolate reductase/thymidylate synthase
MQFELIVAVDSELGLAKNGDLPWKGTPAGREDMEWFKRHTTKPGTALIMGRKTWESIPQKFRPLPGRINVVISSSYSGIEITGALTKSPVVRVNSFEAALKWCADARSDGAFAVTRCMVIGGMSVYMQAITNPWLRASWITVFKKSFDCDMKFNKGTFDVIESCCVNSTEHAGYYVIRYTNTEEHEYLDLMRGLLTEPLRQNRTGVLTRGSFHHVLKFKLIDPILGPVLPLMTTKTVPWKSVYHEAVWFLSGKCTDISYLRERGVPIWDGNTTRQFLDSRGLTDYQPGETGPIYGYQWRHWGGDQLAKVIETLKTDPWDRRMIVSAWNVEQLPSMALPPCHYSFQFHVDPDCDGNADRLNCLVNMRSADVALGVPFNIASYAFITHLVAMIVGLKPGVLSLSMADCHVYTNHFDGINKQLTRSPNRFPTIKFSDRVMAAGELTIDKFVNDFTIDDVIISNYAPQGFIKLPMAV